MKVGPRQTVLTLSANCLVVGLCGILTACEGAPAVSPTGMVPPSRDCRTEFTYRSESETAQVVVSGPFNDWSETADRMLETTPGQFSLKLNLPAGDHPYKLIVDGQWVLDPARPQSIFVRGVENSRMRVEPCANPRLELPEFQVSRDGQLNARIEYVDGEMAKGRGEVRALLNGVSVDTGSHPTSIDVSESGLAPGKYVLEVFAEDAEGRTAPALYLPFWVEASTFAWDGLIYFPMTDRFINGRPDNDDPVEGLPALTNYAGGDFAGITERIESGYFEDLGVSVLWLSPLVKNPGGVFLGDDRRSYAGYHGYWPSAIQETQPRFGSMQELQALVAAAHQRGIRVIADLVLNHVHSAHPHYEDHPEWFNGDGSCVCGQSCDWESRALDCWFSPYLPDYASQSTEVIDTLVDDALWWLKEANLDGFRVDAVKHFERAVVRNLRGHLNEIERPTGTRLLMLGETFVGEGARDQIASYIDDSQLHGQFDFPWYWDVLRVIVRGDGPLSDLEGTMQRAVDVYGDAIMSPMLGNHDVARAYSHAAGDISDLYGSGAKEQAWNNPPGLHDDDWAFNKLKVAFGFLLTQPGLPLIYYGDEAGLPGAGDPDNRRMMPQSLQGRQQGLFAHVARLGQARASQPALRKAGTLVLLAEADTLVYVRGPESTSPVIVALHRGAGTRNLVLDLPPEIYTSLEPTVTHRLGGGTESLENGKLQLSLEPWSVEILSRN